MIDYKRKIESKSNKYGMLHQAHFWLTTVIGVIMVITVFSLIFFFYTKQSYEYQYEKAYEAFGKEDWETALYYADRCLEIREDDIDARLLKVYVYERQNDIDKVILKCEQLLEISTSIKEVYDTLIPYLIQAESYIKLKNILDACNVESVVEKYYDYTSITPSFDLEIGRAHV